MDIDRRRNVAMREIVFPIVTAVIVGIVLGTVSAFGTTYVMANVLDQRVATLEKQQADFRKYVDQMNKTQVKLAEIMTMQQSYLIEVKELKSEFFSSKAAEKQFDNFQRQIDRITKTIEKYH